MHTEASRDVMAALARHKALGSAPAAEHAWLAAHGEWRKYELGEIVVPKGTRSRDLTIVFDGHLVIRVDRGAGSHKIYEWGSGQCGGAMPYSRGASPPNDVIAEEPTDLLAVHDEVFPEMIRECPSVTTTLVHAMVDRAREFTSSGLRDEKLISLGKLAAGLAHELNNPASAVVRTSKLLTASLTDAEKAARQLASANLTDEQFALIESARMVCSSGSAPSLSPMERADREDTITAWLADHGADEDCALTLADTGVSVDALDNLAAKISGDALDGALGWITACCNVRALSSEIETASTRIYDLVSAVKGFSYMDHAPSPEPVDIRKGLTDTVTMLASKTKVKGAQVSLNFADDLPRAYAVGAELNQVWMNLIDNALDAIPQNGRVVIKAERQLKSVVVSITDNGPGIPESIQERIFDPFFTTKTVGAGSGLGLDIVKRLLHRHEGAIDVESSPGRTEFQVRLPAEG
jgi:signal transduction histidine kinase